MMKKLLLSVGLIGLFGGFISIASANTTSCKDVEFSNGVTACVNIVDAGTNRRSLTTNLDNGGSSSNLRCDIMTPDSQLRSIPSCNGEFNYNTNRIGRIKLRIRYNEVAPINRQDKPSDTTERTYPQWEYDFNNAERTDNNINNNYNNNYNNNSNGNLSNFSLTTDDSSPTTYQYVDLNITARDSSNYTISDFSDTVNFKVYYKSPNSSSWIQTTSSSYYAMASNYSSYGYSFSSYDNGIANLSNFIEFKNSSYDYKVRVYDSNNSSIYKEIIYYVNGNGNNNNNNNNSNGNLSNFSLTTDDSSPTTYQYVDLNITARDSSNYTISDFSDTVNFKVYYKSPNSSSWIQTTSSSYYAMASNYSSYGYSFSSYDNGIANLSNFIEFKNSSYDYKVRVYDSNNSSIYKEIIYYVNGNGNNNNNNNNSNINGFSSSELTTVEGIYNGRDDMISSLENTYSRLNNNVGRQTMSNNLKTAMQEIINNNSNKTYDNFADFYAAFLDWYRYTTSIR